MKLIEIKNNFAKLYYLPKEDSLLISDFLTVDDGNRKIIAQIVSVESTSRPETNCAVLKFTMLISSDEKLAPYNGYVPSLDATVNKTDIEVLSRYFGKNGGQYRLGEFSTNSELDLYVNDNFIDNFLYIQSDRIEDTAFIYKEIQEICKSYLYVTSDGALIPKRSEQFVLGKNFKLPMSYSTLNYIYENDLTGLNLEQKAVVQDIILDIQEYIKSETSGYIPFSTLLNVVDSIYQSEKSFGLILFRNKLIKYNQLGLFASSEYEFKELIESSENGGCVSLNLAGAQPNWKKETLDFIVENINSKTHLIVKAADDLLDKDTIAKIYQKDCIKSVFSSGYGCPFANTFKSYAKNLIMFAPESAQKNYATYNSFLSRLSDKEFVVSGEQTFYTPVILKPCPVQKPLNPPAHLSQEEIIEQSSGQTAPVPIISAAQEPEIFAEDEIAIEPQIVSQEVLAQENVFEELNGELEEEPILEPEDDLKNIFEESVEAEIAKDVDSMFYADSQNNDEQNDGGFQEDIIEEDEMFSEDDLDLLDDINSEEDGQLSHNSEEENGLYESAEYESEDNEITLDSLDELVSDEQEVLSELEPLSFVNELPEEKTLEVKSAPVPNLPIYKTEYDDPAATEASIKVAEGNIVYHQKYGRGVVEQIISYGKKTLCSIQFDNIGRRLLDPNLADLKQA